MIERGRHRVGHGVRDRAQAEERADVLLARPVVALAEVVVADVSRAVDQVLGRPVGVGVVVPGAVVVVLDDRVVDPESLHGGADVRGDVLEGELRRVDADDHEPVAVVVAVPGLEVRQRAQAVDARVGPEVDQDDLPAKLAERQRRRVEPPAARVERRSLAVDRQRGPRAARRAPARSFAPVTFARARRAAPVSSTCFWSAWV